MSRTQAERLMQAWRAAALNHDAAVGQNVTRDYLKELSGADFSKLPWSKAFAERKEQFPKFFELYDYDWVNDPRAFDFPLETSLQIRTLDAAIALWRSPLEAKPPEPDFGNIAARITYLPRLDRVTPRVQRSDGFKFVITPLGWLEYLHRYFAAYAATSEESGQAADAQEGATPDAFRSIFVILIASYACRLDFVVPQLVDAISEEVPYFRGASVDFDERHTTARAADLAYAAHDFALCHEVAHILAEDFQDPDELRADWWGLNAYYGSWAHRPPLHPELGPSDPTRAAVGPIVFGSVLRSLLSARVAVAQKLGSSTSALARDVGRYSAIAARSKGLFTQTLEHRARFVGQPEPEAEAKAYARLVAMCESLFRFEVAFAEFTKTVPADACRDAFELARRLDDKIREEAEQR